MNTLRTPNRFSLSPFFAFVVVALSLSPSAKAEVCTSLNDTNCYRFLCNGMLASGQLQGSCYQNLSQCTAQTASRWDQHTVEIRVDLSTLPTGINAAQWSNVVTDAFSAWTDVPGSDLNLQNVGSTQFRSFGANNNSHEVFWINNASEFQSKVGAGINNALGVTVSPRSCGNGVNSFGFIYDADLVMNGAGDFSWVDRNSSCAGLGCPSALSVLIHELGHFVGVDHPCVDCSWSIMAATSGISDLEQPAPIDRSAISALYPGVPGGLGYGCSNTNDCVAAPLCATVGALSYCTQSCGNCPTGFACENIAGEGDICVFSSGSLAPPVGRGEVCNPTPCQDGLECLQFQQDTTDGQCVAFCTPSASTNPECTEYEDCFSITQDDSLGACIPLYGDVGVGEVCNFEDNLCQRDSYCIGATAEATEGECYAQCNPEAATNPSCSANDECVSVSSTDATLGACFLSYGDVESGGVCGDEARMCQRGNSCLLVEEGAELGVCFTDCDTASGGCAAEQRCTSISATTTEGVCLDPVPLGGVCGVTNFCEGEASICLLTQAGATDGTCFATCDPNAADNPNCGANDACFPYSADGNDGYCDLAYGDVPRGGTCSAAALCEQGNVCLLVVAGAEDGICFESCDPANDACVEREQCEALTGGGGACFPEPVELSDGGTVVIIPGVDGGSIVVTPSDDGGISVVPPDPVRDAGSDVPDVPDVPEGSCRPERGNIDCDDGESCEPTTEGEGACIGGAGSSPMGGLCDTPSECASGLCHNGVCTQTCDVEGGCPGGYICDEELVIGGLCKAESCSDDEGICDDGYSCAYTSASRYACATGVEITSGCSCDAQTPNQSAQMMWAGLLLWGLALNRRSRKR